MLTQKQVAEIKEHLERAQNPVFFFDNDQDGLCSFLLLQRYIGRGKGIAVKSFPEMDAGYFKRVEELNSDYIFILDKPIISNGFFEEAGKFNLPIVWIDHHEIQTMNIPEDVKYFNPIYNEEKTNEPVTALCYQISQRKEDLWIAVIGCISDRFYPSFYSEFFNQFPELGINTDDAFDIFYKTGIGKLARILGFGLKDRTTNVVNMLKFLVKAKGPYDVLEENSKNQLIHERFFYLSNKYEKLLEKAVELKSESKILFFEYGGDLSISGDLANELSYKFPNKIIVVGYIKGAKINISARGKNVKLLLLKAIEGIDGGRGGGHECAVGAQLKVEDLEIFKKKMLELVK